MSEAVQLTIDGHPVQVPAGVSVAAALLTTGVGCFRHSVTGEPRGPLCGMGICYECRLTIDGVAQQRSCLRRVESGMRVTTGDDR